MLWVNHLYQESDQIPMFDKIIRTAHPTSDSSLTPKNGMSTLINSPSFLLCKESENSKKTNRKQLQFQNIFEQVDSADCNSSLCGLDFPIKVLDLTLSSASSISEE